MVDAALLKRDNLNAVFEQSLANFLERGFPACLLVSGVQNKKKFDKVFQVVKTALFHSLLLNFSSGQVGNDDERKSIEQQIDRFDYADLYYFAAEKVSIGETKNPVRGSIRHLLQHFLPFAPRFGSIRFVVFAEASLINDEAETALLKSLEEPPAGTHFILFCQNASSLKETILSRCLEIHFREAVDYENLGDDSWQKFWRFSGYENSPLYEIMQQQQWLDYMAGQYDQLGFTSRDYPVFDSLLFTHFKKTFDKQSNDIQAQLLKLTILPLYFALRDNLIEDSVETLGPIRVPRYLPKQNIVLMQIIEQYFARLEKKIFNTMTPHLATVNTLFVTQLMKHWSVTTSGASPQTS